MATHIKLCNQLGKRRLRCKVQEISFDELGNDYSHRDCYSHASLEPHMKQLNKNLEFSSEQHQLSLDLKCRGMSSSEIGTQPLAPITVHPIFSIMPYPS